MLAQEREGASALSLWNERKREMEVARVLYNELTQLLAGIHPDAQDTEAAANTIARMYFEAKKEIETLKGIQDQLKAMAMDILAETGEVKRRTDHGSFSLSKGKKSTSIPIGPVRAKMKSDRVFAGKMRGLIKKSIGKPFITFRG